MITDYEEWMILIEGFKFIFILLGTLYIRDIANSLRK
jgi:hypothetical protein